MKSKIEVREFAVTKAVEIMGAGAIVKDVVAKAREIEACYRRGGASRGVRGGFSDRLAQWCCVGC